MTPIFTREGSRTHERLIKLPKVTSASDDEIRTQSVSGPKVWLFSVLLCAWDRGGEWESLDERERVQARHGEGFTWV